MTEHNSILTDTINDPTLLRQLGWSDHFERRVASMKTANQRIARVISVQRGLFMITDGGREWLCPPSGKLLHSTRHDYPVTGDWVLTDNAVVTSVIPRKTLLSRGGAGSRSTRAQAAHREQPIAANLDTVFVVCGLDRDFNVRRLERYLTLVHNCSLSPVVVLTKADLHDSTAPLLREVEAIAFGVPVVVTSMLDNRGKAELEHFLGQGQTVAMIGSSGAGKSTLANMLHGSDIKATGAVSPSGGKGCHTTTTRELIRMPQGGLLMDNPGIREIAFHENGHGVDNAFADIRELAGSCRFADCSHHREPGCAVLHAVEAGELARDRLESYHKMQREMRYLSERDTKSADRIEKERWQGVARLRKSLNKRNRK